MTKREAYKRAQRKEKVLVTLALLVIIALFCLCSFIETHYYRNGEVISVSGQLVEVEDFAGLTWEFYADGFRVGDEVMHVKKNHADVSVLNGDTGVIKRIFKDDDGETSIEVEYDGADEPYYYTRHNIEELTLAYTLTVHKSQGSEYDTVIVCLTRYHGVMLKRNILYTAITRAKKKVIVITSDIQSLDVAVRNNQAEDRYTLLTKYLRDAYFATDTANMSGEKLKSMIDATVVKYA